MSESKLTERMEVWVDGGSVQIIAVTSLGDPIDCNVEQARAFADAIKECCDRSDGKTNDREPSAIDS